MEKLLQYMETHSQSLATLNSKIEGFDGRLRYLEQTGSHAALSAESHPSPQEEQSHPKRKPVLDDHRTPPHKLLLLWPSVKPLLDAADVHLNDGYVMEAEDRGILRLYTRGEGIDEHDGTQPGGPASPARSEDSGGEINAPSPLQGLWGIGLPPAPIADIRRSEPYTWGGLKPDNSLDLDVNTINALYDSYIKNIHVMHPFLDKQRLRRLVDAFIKSYAGGQPKMKPCFAVSHNNSDFERSAKRLRTNEAGGAVSSGTEGGTYRVQPSERSPGNAIVYLVLALGKICLHRDPLPAVVPDNRLYANSVVTHQLNRNMTGSSPVSANIKPSPISPKSTPATQPTPPAESHYSHQSRSRRSSMDGMPHTGARNLDVIPGIAYYAKAAEILGDQGDGNDLVHAQMFLLAGLYKGQLARVKESMSWFSMAGRAVLSLLDRYKLYNENYWTAYGGDVKRRWEKSQKLNKDKRTNLIVLAAWTCLQLESDILAELRLPSSHIQEIENLLLMPQDVPEDEAYDTLDPGDGQDDHNMILIYYTAQMYLRKRLNMVHREMYGPDCADKPLDEVRDMLQGHENILELWRNSLPPQLRWRDEDPPASNILAARLRAKYWGAKYVVNRPFLDYALHILPYVRDGTSVHEVARDVHGNYRDKAEINLFEAIEGLGEAAVWRASMRCIEAAMQSTIALDGAGQRLVVTNIHGTAHA